MHLMYNNIKPTIIIIITNVIGIITTNITKAYLRYWIPIGWDMTTLRHMNEVGLNNFSLFTELARKRNSSL